MASTLHASDDLQHQLLAVADNRYARRDRRSRHLHHVRRASQERKDVRWRRVNGAAPGRDRQSAAHRFEKDLRQSIVVPCIVEQALPCPRDVRQYCLWRPFLNALRIVLRRHRERKYVLAIFDLDDRQEDWIGTAAEDRPVDDFGRVGPWTLE